MKLAAEDMVFLDDEELEIADHIAKCLRQEEIDNVGLFIWKTCRRHGVDHKKIAAHIGGRRRR